MKLQQIHILLCLAALGGLSACDDNPDSWTQTYELAWRYDTNTQISVGKAATFTDLSLGVETREWSFEDATPATSTLPEPSVMFNSRGTKEVTLKVNYLNGRSETATFDVEVFYPLNADIAPRTLTSMGCLRLNEAIAFDLEQVEGDPTSYYWTFEGGSPATSTDRSPEVTWTAPNATGAKISCKLTRADDNMTMTVEKSYIVGNYPLLYPIPDRDYDPWHFELSSFGKWTLWNGSVGVDDVSANCSIISGGADGTSRAMKVALQQNVPYQFFPRDNWVCNAQLVAGKRYEISFWQKSDAPQGSLLLILSVYNFLPSWSWNEYLQILAGDHWSQYFPDIPFQEQDEEMQNIWSCVDYPLNESVTLPAIPELVPTSTWKQVRFEFTAASAKYTSLLNAYPMFALMSAGGDTAWYVDEMQINLIED